MTFCVVAYTGSMDVQPVDKANVANAQSSGDQLQGRSVVRRVAQVLDAYTSHSRWGVRELAAYIDVPKSGLHRILQELAAENFLHVDEEGSYAVGGELLHLAAGLMRSVEITRVAYPYMLEARNASGEATVLVAYDAGRQQIIGIDTAETMHPVQFPWGGLRQWTDIHLSASGRAILAFLPSGQLEKYFSVPRKLANGDAVDVRKMSEELAAIRARGWAISHGERIPGTSGVSAPVFDARGVVVGGVVIAWPHRSELADNGEWIGPICADAAGAISAQLGWKAERRAGR
jgi:DNA-binding IclR family transcriptional regulator